MRVLLFTGSYIPGYKAGGPIKTIKNLCFSLSGRVSFKVITSDRDLGDSMPYSQVRCGAWNKCASGADIFYAQPGFSGLRQIITLLFGCNYDLIYINSFFSPRFSFFPLVISKILGKSVVVAPRGELSSGALDLKWLKKSIFIFLYKIIGLSSKVIYQASSQYEEDDIRKALGDKVNIYVAENISSCSFPNSLKLRSESPLRLMVVSRISPIKNLLEALEILSIVECSVIYHIYGPIEDHNYWKKCEAIIDTLPSFVSVEYKGELLPNEVAQVMASYDFFFMPTQGENYGHAIVEALCSGLPLLISNTTPWRNLHSLGIGWDLPLSDLSKFSSTIESIAIMSPAQHLEMRKNTLAWAKDKFNQQASIEANMSLLVFAHKFNR